MKNIADNNLIRFMRIMKKKDGLHVIFKAIGMKGGAQFSATISVDMSAAEVDPALDSLEKIIDHCAKIAVKEFRKSELEFEGIGAV